MASRRDARVYRVHNPIYTHICGVRTCRVCSKDARGGDDGFPFLHNMMAILHPILRSYILGVCFCVHVPAHSCAIATQKGHKNTGKMALLSIYATALCTNQTSLYVPTVCKNGCVMLFIRECIGKKTYREKNVTVALACLNTVWQTQTRTHHAGRRRDDVKCNAKLCARVASSHPSSHKAKCRRCVNVCVLCVACLGGSTQP